MGDSEKELKNFMEKKNLEAKGVIMAEKEDEGDVLSNAPKSIKQETGAEDIRAAKALAKARMILNFFVVLPIILATILLLGYILIKILPSVLSFLRKFIFLLMKD